jgi:GrpB-like predicted nucleotidyltransferase (UPF0157 family)
MHSIQIIAYDSEWPAFFSRLGAELRAALGDVALRIDHVGSTAVPGLDAKPIIDVLISVAGLEPLDAYLGPLESLGFRYRPDNPDRSKRYFRESPGARRTHIHVMRAGSWQQQLLLLFRDYLRAHDDDAKPYAELKRELALRFGEDRNGYTEAKGPFIWEVTAKAHAWGHSIGWGPGPSDA